jgi:hypothetical protein
MIVKNELFWTWKEAAVAYFKILPGNLRVGTERDNETLSLLGFLYAFPANAGIVRNYLK